MQFEQVPSDLLETLQLNAGVLTTGFTPATGVIGTILGATTGGITFNANPNYVDFGEDVDNVPANTWQMKRVTHYDPVISGTFVSLSSSARVKQLVGAATIDTLDSTHIIPDHALKETDFADVWWIGDYSDKNKGAATAGYVAIHVKNALNTIGFQITSTKDGKGQFPFEYHGHYDYEDIEDAPFEVYLKAGTAITQATLEAT